MLIRSIFILLCLLVLNCSQAQNHKLPQQTTSVGSAILPAAEAQFGTLVERIKTKRVALVANQSSMVNQNHLVDTLWRVGVDIKRVFAPEHGFRGTHSAGEKVEHAIDSKTGLELVSLYGENKKPKPEQLKDVDVLVFDIQDVGLRFYTYISTLHYVMEACAEHQIKLIVLDRPNPNAHYIDGPMLKKNYQSFVGMHPVPVVYGMTIGEYAQMINGENWLKDGIQCELEVLMCEHYTHQKIYTLPVKPSPNLPNDQSINLYPSLCFFEGTSVSIGRGTPFPFQVFGHPEWRSDFSFTPTKNEGAKYPKHEHTVCYGFDLRSEPRLNQLHLTWLIDAYNKSKAPFFNEFFNTLAGNSDLQEKIKEGKSDHEIRASWKSDLEAFKKTRANYLIY
ncbi:MAG: exo-beta-N-acetylmuramidase NamZ family protein [Flavobacteriales bacterium]